VLRAGVGAGWSPPGSCRPGRRRRHQTAGPTSAWAPTRRDRRVLASEAVTHAVRSPATSLPRSLSRYVPYAHDHLGCFDSLLRKPLRDPHSHERLIRNTLPLCDQLGTLDLLRLQSERDGFLLSRTFSDSTS